MSRLSLLDTANRTGAMAERKPKKWMQSAVPDSRKGVFTRKAEAAGKSVAEYASEKSDAPGAIGKEARLAQTFEKMAARRHRMYPKMKSKP